MTVAVKQAARSLAADAGREHVVWATHGLRRYRWYAVEAILDPLDDFPPIIAAEHEGRAFTYEGAQRAAANALDPDIAEASARLAASLSLLSRPRRALFHVLDRASSLAFMTSCAAVIAMFVSLVRLDGVAILASLLICATSLQVGLWLEDRAESVIERAERALGLS